MKKLILPIAVATILVLFFAGINNSFQSPGAKTGSPADVQTCALCHSGTATPQDNWISTNIPADGYTPGETYTITATGTHQGVQKFGFELTAEDNALAKQGTFSITNTNEMTLTNNDAAVTHKSAGTSPSGNTKSWSTDWVAPLQGTGEVTFYAAFLAANGNGNTSGDVVYTSSTSVQENVGNAIDETAGDHKAVQLIRSGSELLVSYPLEGHSIVKLKIFDTSGKIVEELSQESIGEFIGKVNLQNYKSGMYIIRLQADNKVVSSKFTVN